MVSTKQRQRYLIIVSIFIILGMILYGLLAAVFALFSCAFLYALLGGIMFGGIASGIILFSRYMTQKSTAFKVLSYVLFPITLSIVSIVGYITLLPYYISNLIIFIRTKNNIDTKRISEISLKTKKITYLVYACFIIVIFIGYYIYNAINEINIINDIYKETGYTAGSPDYVILRNYYYSGSDTDYNKTDYVYKVKNNTLFILAKNDSICYSNILFAQSNGKYRIESEYLKSGDFYGGFLKQDIDELFTDVRIANKENNHAYMLIIDARSKQEQIKQIMKTWRNMDEQAAAGFLDSTHADIDKIQLFDEKGTSLETISVAGGIYIAFYDSFNSDNTDYEVIVSYEGKKYTLLTYENIVNCSITVSD